MAQHSQFHLISLESRITPSTLIHGLLPSPLGPQLSGSFGRTIAASANYRAVAAPYVNAIGVEEIGQVYVYDSMNAHIATLNDPGPSTGLQFGWSLAADGDYVAVGRLSGGDNVPIFDMKSATPSIPMVILNNPGSTAVDRFGASIAISGQYIVIGDYLDDGVDPDTGTAYVFDLKSATPNVPIRTYHNPTPVSGDLFGIAVAIRGNNVVISAPSDDTGFTNAGSVYYYDLNSTSNLPVATINNPGSNDGSGFGRTVAVSENRIVVGSPETKATATRAGKVFVYPIGSTSPLVISNPEPEINDYFGDWVTIAGNTVGVGVPEDDFAASNAGSIYVFDLGSSTPSIPIQTLRNPTPESNGYFGRCLSIVGSQIISGAEGDNTNLGVVGAAYVFDLASPTPTVPSSTLENVTPAVNSSFGCSTAMSGEYLVVGAQQDSSQKYRSGAAYVYNLNSAMPTEPLILLNPTPAQNDFFGCSVSISGNFAVIGARADDTGATDAGSVYVYDLASKTPAIPIQTLNNPSKLAAEAFGISVAIHGDRIVVGASSAGGIDDGKAYVYDLKSTAPAMPIATLSNPIPDYFTYFGISVAISEHYVLVGSRSNTGANGSGSVYVYDVTALKSPPIWALTNPSPGAGDRFYSVAIDGKRVIVGADGDDTNATDAGSVYLFDLGSATPTVPVVSWHNPAKTAMDYFGNQVGIDGNYVIVGAYGSDTVSIDAGAAYLFDTSFSTPTIPIGILANPSAQVDDRFGSAVAISGLQAAVGAFYDDDQNLNQGAAYVYSIAPVHIDTIVIGDGNAQRSMVTSITINFDSIVNFVGSPVSAFSLTNIKSGLPVALSAKVGFSGSGTSVTLVFAGGSVDPSGSLADGRYTLTIAAAKIAGDGLDGNGDGIAGDDYVLVGSPANGLFRLFGDSDGNGSVSATDFSAFRLAMGESNPIFDFNNDGIVSASDFNQFRLRYGMLI